jgi:Ca2+-binding EF-hand superfamily protein
MQVRDNILRCNFVFEPLEIWEGVSAKAKQFISRLLVTNPNMRPTAREAQQDPWLIEMADLSRNQDDIALNPNVVKALVNFKEYSDMRKLLCEVLSFTLIPDQIQGLRKEFEKMDTDGSGEISMIALKTVLLGNAAQGSLGALTEKEVEDIFNAMRVSKTETTIHWHEFIAAGLSHCKVDERNLRLAFDRLDSDHTGYITFENFMDLIGNGAAHSEEALRAMWGEASMSSKDAHITYDDFLLLMKGQTKPSQPKVIQPKKRDSAPTIDKLELPPVIEHSFEGGSADSSYDDFLHAHKGQAKPSQPKIVQPKKRDSTPTTDKPGLHPVMEHSFEGASTETSATSGGFISSFEKEEEESDGPICIDDEGDDGTLNQYLKSGVAIKGSLVHPSDLEPPPDETKSIDIDENPPSGKAPAVWKDKHKIAVNLPEHYHDNEKFNVLLNDKSKTPLVVNRELYRAHRIMRLAVLDASKRLDDERQRRAREEMRKEQALSNKGGAGLIMRHGGELSADAIKQFVVQQQKEEQRQVKEASKRAGRRHGHARNKTTSDIRGMFGSYGSDLANLTTPPIRQTVAVGGIPDFGPPTPRHPLSPPKTPPEVPNAPGLPEVPVIRNRTVPGQFRKTDYDPFSFGTMSSEDSMIDSSMHRHLMNGLPSFKKMRAGGNEAIHSSLLKEVTSSLSVNSLGSDSDLKKQGS